MNIYLYTFIKYPSSYGSKILLGWWARNPDTGFWYTTPDKDKAFRFPSKITAMKIKGRNWRTIPSVISIQ